MARKKSADWKGNKYWYALCDTLTLGDIKRFLSYDSDTGTFVWIGQTSRRIAIGSKAGNPDNRGYWIIKFAGKRYKAHSLAWWWCNNALPPTGYDIDHIDGNPLNNAIANLRIVTRSQNHMNRGPKKNGTSPYKGVCRAPNGKWQANIRYQGKNYNLGHYLKEVDAARAYDARASRLFGEFARINFPEGSHHVRHR